MFAWTTVENGYNEHTTRHGYQCCPRPPIKLCLEMVDAKIDLKLKINSLPCGEVKAHEKSYFGTTVKKMCR